MAEDPIFADRMLSLGLARVSEAAAIACSHVSTDPPPAESASQATASAGAIELSRLANGSNR